MTTPETCPSEGVNKDETHDTTQTRLRRPEPKRTGPIRNASGYFRDSHSWGEDPHPPWPEPADVIDDAITQGVRLGYRVIGQHLERGREEAARLGDTTDEHPTADPDIQRLLHRVQDLSKDFGALCFDAVELIAHNPLLQRWLSRGEAGSHTDSATNNAAARTPAFPIEVASRKPAVVELQLTNPGEAFQPGVHALYGGDPAFPPLTRIEFRDDPAYTAPVLAIAIPDRQPAGLYTGVVVDRASNAPKGTVSVRILA
jgi:hypothetical protein